MEKFFPRRLSFRKICGILTAYLNAGAEKDFIGLSEVANKSEVDLHNISRNNNFLRSWGFIEESKESAGKYKLNKMATDFASAYRLDPEGDSTRRLLKEFLSQDKLIKKFVENIRDDKDRKSLLVQLPSVIGDFRADKVGLNAFLDMLYYAFNIKNSLCRKTRRTTIKNQTESNSDDSVDVPIRSGEKPSLSILLSLDSKLTSEKLKCYVKAVLEAYDEYYRGS